MTTKSKSVFYDLQEPVKDDFNYIGDSVEDQLRKRAADLFNDGILGLSSFEITIDPGSNNQTVKFSVGPGTAYVGSRRVEILSDDTTTYNELNPVKNLLNGECPKSTGCKDVTVSVSSGSDCVTVFLLYAKDYDENVCIIDPETYGKRYTRERSGYAIGYAVGTRDNRPVLPKQFDTGGVWANYRENSSDPAASWTVGYSYIIIADLLYTGSEWVVDRTRCQRIILREEVQPSEEVEKHQVTHHTNGISSLTETSFKYYKYAVKDLLGEGSFRTVSTPISLTYTSPITTTEIYIRIAVSNATNQDLTITIYDTDNTEIDHKTFTFTSSANTVTYSYTSTTSFTVGKVSVSSTGSNITVNYKTVNGVDTPKTHTIYRDTTDTDTYDEYLPFVIPQLDNNGINQSDCIMIRDTLTENRSFMYVNGKRITKFLFRGIELSSVQWTDNKKYFVLKNLTQTDFGGQTGTFYLVVDENGSIGFSTSLDPLKLALAILNVQYSINNTWLPSNVGGLSIELQKDIRYLVDSHKKLRLSEYPIEIVPTDDQSSQTPEIVLSANTTSFANIPYLPLRIRIENDSGKSKLVFEGGTGNNILTILDNGNVGIGTTSPNRVLSIIDSGVGIDRPDTNTLSFYTNNTEQLRIDSSGNVGIGTGTSPLSQKLVVAGNIGLKTNTDAFIGTLDTFGLSLRTNNTDRIYITNEGNVGIGTNPTNFKLQIDGNTGPNIDNTYDLGSTSYRWKSLYLGGGSLNIDQIGGTNYERLTIGYDTNNNRFQILTTVSGTGTLRPLYLTTGTNNGITIDTNGNVGIGTATPLSKLDVNGGVAIGTYAGNNTAPSNGLIVSGNVGIGTTASLDKLTIADGVLGIRKSAGVMLTLRDTTNNISYNFFNTNGRLGFVNNSDQEVVSFLQSGNVGIGTTAPGYKLDVNGSAHATSFPTSSDIRFKADVKPISDALDIVMNLEGVRFRWNDFYKNTLGVDCDTEKYEFGVIAQEAEKVAPEVVTKFKRQYKEKTEDGEEVDKEEEFLSVDYGRLVAVLIEAIKEQQRQIEELKQWIGRAK